MDFFFVIFDKDGILIDVNIVWILWMESYVREFEEVIGFFFVDKMYEEVGFCFKKRIYFDGGLLVYVIVVEIR